MVEKFFLFDKNDRPLITTVFVKKIIFVKKAFRKVLIKIYIE